MKAEITNISAFGLWILTNEKEFFVDFDKFPWFKNQSIADITQVENQGFGHLYWKNLDIDLSLNMIENPDKYPLTYSAK
ncbi:MAG: DUF2442 domain-containing protein [Gammaproteobacteria bacterium]|nr:MAG: DUF2442 domain-containing protein [Gammaproteobacteria bacterium]